MIMVEIIFICIKTCTYIGIHTQMSNNSPVKKEIRLNFSHPWSAFLFEYNVDPAKYNDFYDKFGYYVYSHDNEDYKKSAFQWIIANSQSLPGSS
jgi:hypothetical protein